MSVGLFPFLLVGRGWLSGLLPVEVLGGADGDEGVGVCEGREDSDSVVVWWLANAAKELVGLRERTRWSFRTMRGPP